jgi:hypothetical protein
VVDPSALTVPPPDPTLRAGCTLVASATAFRRERRSPQCHAGHGSLTVRGARALCPNPSGNDRLRCYVRVFGLSSVRPGARIAVMYALEMHTASWESHNIPVLKPYGSHTGALVRSVVLTGAASA